MKLKHLFLLIAIAGAALPMSQFIPASIAGEFTLRSMFADITATRIATGFTLDLAVSALAGVTFIVMETIRLKIRAAWIPLLGTFLIGFSFGLPFFLYLRERRLEAAPV